MKHYKIGARGSLLSVTQTKLMQKELEALTGDKFEIITIKTQGDLNTSVPLWQMQGKDFFTKELDEALLKNEIDLVVHSYKDLGSVRPEGIKLAAVTKRSFAHDILLIKDETIAKLKEKDHLVIGTSSPRRIINIEKNLASYLPYCEGKKVSTKMLRGNVNTRIKKLCDGEYDAIVLAMAGLERLTSNEEALKELSSLLEDLNFMILPQSTFPSSASQGALAIECLENRKDNGELYQKLSKLTDQDTLEEVKRERVAFNRYGGGCHLAVGIHVRKVGPYYLHFHQGEVDHKPIKEKFLEPKPIALPQGDYFSGMNDSIIEMVSLAPDLSSHNHYLVSSRHCLSALSTIPKKSMLWSSGVKTHQKMAAAGHWVHGSADSFGMMELNPFISSKLVQLLMKNHGINAQIKVLTNDLSEHDDAPSIATYTRKIKAPNAETKVRILATKLFYWTSFFQYQTYLSLFPELSQNDRVHTCGLGKTWKEFEAKGLKVIPLPGPDYLKTLSK
ncbi:MAG: hydroxymethylbilane synthase [Bacteriovoracaceae bacterium]